MVLALLSGCGSGKDPWVDNRPKTAPVAGRVLHKGQPLEDAVITFHADEIASTAYGRTDREGRFKLTTFEPADGATIGGHKVSIQKFENLPPPADPESAPRGPRPEPKSLIPERYGNPQTSSLVATVVDGEKNEVEFELK